MKRLIAAFMISLAITSCGTLKKSTKTETEAVKTETTAKSVETTTVTEKATTTITTQADTVKASKDIDKILEGDTITKETEHTSIKTYYDKNTKEIKTEAISKPQTIPVNIDRTTVATKTTETATKTESVTEKKESSKERESPVTEFKWLFFWMLLVVVAIYFLYRQIKKTPPDP